MSACTPVLATCQASTVCRTDCEAFSCVVSLFFVFSVGHFWSWGPAAIFSCAGKLRPWVDWCVIVPLCPTFLSFLLLCLWVISPSSPIRSGLLYGSLRIRLLWTPCTFKGGNLYDLLYQTLDYTICIINFSYIISWMLDLCSSCHETPRVIAWCRSHQTGRCLCISCLYPHWRY